MKKTIKILMCIFSISSFYIQAMQEIKQEAESKEVIELRELKRRFPHSVNFLIKVLGEQKSKEKTLLDKINPFAKTESEVIIKGLPNDIILKIINNYLRIDLVKHENNRKRIIKVNDIISSTMDFYPDSSLLFDNYDDIDSMRFFPMSINGSEVYHLSIGKIRVHPDGSRGMYRYGSDFKFMNYSKLDINTKLTNFEVIVQKANDNKYKIVAGFVSIAGLTYYLVKKLKKL